MPVVFAHIGGVASAHTSLLAGIVVWAYGDFVADWTAPFLTASPRRWWRI